MNDMKRYSKNDGNHWKTMTNSKLSAERKISLPSSMALSQNEIRMVHEASVTGNLEAITHKEYRQSVYTARDTNGISAFHKVNLKDTPVHLMC